MRQARRLDLTPPGADDGVAMAKVEGPTDRPSTRDVLVLTVDDQASFLAVARRVLEAVPGFRCIGEATSGEEAITFVRLHPPDLVVMDVRMPGMGGLDAAQQIAADAPEVAILLVSADEAEAAAFDEAESPCATFARKQDFGSALLRAVVSGRHHQGRAERP
jgi:two-component system invasion response regulator UvrY